MNNVERRVWEMTERHAQDQMQAFIDARELDLKERKMFVNALKQSLGDLFNDLVDSIVYPVPNHSDCTVMISYKKENGCIEWCATRNLLKISFMGSVDFIGPYHLMNEDQISAWLEKVWKKEY